MRMPGGRAAGMSLAMTLTLVFGAVMPANAREAVAAPELASLTLERVIELLRTGIPSSNITTLIKRQGGDFHPTVDDVVRLRKMGAMRPPDPHHDHRRPGAGCVPCRRGPARS